MYAFSSPNVAALGMELLAWARKLCCIIFVERKLVAKGIGLLVTECVVFLRGGHGAGLVEQVLLSLPGFPWVQLFRRAEGLQSKQVVRGAKAWGFISLVGVL